MAALLLPGQPAPWFHGAALDGNPNYAFNTAGGRWMLMLLMGSSANPATKQALALVQANRSIFDDRRACFYGVTVDPQDAAGGNIAQQLPGIRWFLDYDRAISKLYHAIETEGKQAQYRPHWLLIDPMMRVRKVGALLDGQAMMAALAAAIATPVVDIPAPVLVVPDVFPSALCRELIHRYEQNGGTQSGFMREENGLTVLRVDPNHKRRSDHIIDDPVLIRTLKARMKYALIPMIQRAFQFEVTRVERFIVACYDAAEGGHFRPHRDNSTKGTAHRRFACTINLNADDYEGGDLCFPEFGTRTYRAPTGGAVIFSCSLLHEARPITKGRRFAFLPFFYDEIGAQVRERNANFLSPELNGYKSGPHDASSPGTNGHA